jgi:hypothetical protein
MPIQQQAWQPIASCAKPVGYIGNAKNLKSPFGSVADLRIYPYALEAEAVKEISELKNSQTWEQSLPDMHIHSFFANEYREKNRF